MRFSFSAGITVAVRVFSVLLMGISSVVIARMLGPEGQGLVAALTAAVAIVLQFGNLGLYASNIRFVSEDRKLYSKAAGNSLTIGVILGLCLFIALAVSTKIIPAAYAEIPAAMLVFYATSLPFSLITMLSQGMLLAVDRIKKYNLLVLLRALLVLVGSTIILVVLHQGVREIIILLVLIEVFTSIMHLAVTYLIEKFRPSFDLNFLFSMMKYGLKVYVATQMTYLVLKFDILLVNYFLGLEQAGVYSISAKIADLLYMVPATIAIIFFPKATALGPKAKPFTDKILLGVSAIMAPSCIILFVLAGPLITLPFGDIYAGAITPLKILIPGIFFISLETILMSYFASKTMPYFAVATPILGVLTNIVLNIFWIPAYGIEGAAASSTISYTLMFLILLWFYRKN